MLKELKFVTHNVKIQYLIVILVKHLIDAKLVRRDGKQLMEDVS